MDRRRKAEFGDFQTPRQLAREALSCFLRDFGSGSPAAATIVEPTCGIGTFLLEAGSVMPGARLLGFEINADYCESARIALQAEGREGVISQEDFFSVPWKELAAAWAEPIWILGNPPWVTVSGVARLGGANRPEKENRTKLVGLNAKTGKSNFDLSEWMILDLLEAVRGRDFLFGMLCKEQVARKLLEATEARGLPIEGNVRRIDAAAHFSASVDAIFLQLRPGTKGGAWPVYESLSAEVPVRKMGISGGRIYSDMDLASATRHLEKPLSPRVVRRANLDGPSAWRSGMKHDLRAVMELVRVGAQYKNGEGELVSLEEDLIYPLLKGSDVFHGRAPGHRHVLVPQKKLGDATDSIASQLSKTARYLERNRERFEGRKSSIYKGRPPYSVFGIGSYSFAPYKVAICGLYRRLAFSLVGPHEGKPVIFDDTVYFLSFESEAAAKETLTLLQTTAVSEFFNARAFWNAKRPINKALLDSLDLSQLTAPSPDSLRASAFGDQRGEQRGSPVVQCDDPPAQIVQVGRRAIQV